MKQSEDNFESGDVEIFDLFKPDTALFSWKLVDEKQPNKKNSHHPNRP